MSELVLKAVGLTIKYDELTVLNGVSIEVKKGEIVSIVGASGAGKTTLLQILGTLDKPTNGTIAINNQDITTFSEKKLAKFRNENIGFIFQFHHLLPEFSAIENVCIPAFIKGDNQKKAETRAKELLTMLKLEHRMEHKPSALSGGEQQRVAVARALMNNPAIIFADEPSGNLDSDNAKDLHQLFFELRDKFNQTFIIVTHNPNLAKMADRCIEMKDGKIL